MENEYWAGSMRVCIKCEMPQVGSVQYCNTAEGTKFRCTTCGAMWGAGVKGIQNHGDSDPTWKS